MPTVYSVRISTETGTLLPAVPETEPTVKYTVSSISAKAVCCGIPAQNSIAAAVVSAVIFFRNISIRPFM